MLKLMLFDLWGTLFDHDGANEGPARGRLRAQLAIEELARRGHAYSPGYVDAAFARADSEHGRIHDDGRDLTAEGRTVLYLRHLDDGLAEQLDDDGWRAMHRAILETALTVRPVLMPGAVEAVAAVKALGLPTCLVSNAGLTPGYVLRQILDDYGILPLLDHTIFSDEVELAKPATAIFEQALDAFGVAPEHAAFLGDQPLLDVLGPQSAGIWTVQLGDLQSDGITPHVRISSLDELVPALRQIEAMG